MAIWQSVEQQITNATGKVFEVTKTRSVNGGCINEATILQGTLNNESAAFFMKTNQTGSLSMFAAEAQALQEMSESQTIRVPAPVCVGEDGDKSFIVMEQLDLTSAQVMTRLGQVQLAHDLAAMHAHTSQQFGWSINNTIGSTEQINTWSDNWLSFWCEQRLGFQLELAASKGYGGELQSLGERLLADMAVLFTGREVKASMLHGDLWGGNVSGLPDGTPVIFDPAFYYGDYEAELAMSELFGGFSADFYAAYHEARPQEDGYELRKTLYNSYHIINHLNMFGGGYHAQAVQMLKQVVAQL